MTAATITEFSHMEIAPTVDSGTPVRRAIVFLRATVDCGGSNTVTLTTYLPEAADIEGIMSHTEDGVESTVPTWSTITLTLVDVGVCEVSFIATLT